MKLKIVFFILMYCSTLSAQDIIFYLDGNEQKAKVLKVGKKEIVFKKYNNLNGPEYIEYTSNIFKIKYKDGGSDIFNSIKEKNSNDNLYILSSGRNIESHFKK